MRILTLLSLVLTAMTLVSTGRAATYVYVSKPTEQQIQIYRLDPTDGSLKATATIATEGAPGALSVDADRRYFFASLRTNSSVASFRIDTEGGLASLGRTQLETGRNAAYLRPDRSGKWLLSASYAGGNVVSQGIADGVIGGTIQSIDTAKTAHFVSIDRSNTWVFVPHVAPNAVFQFRLDPATGILSPAGQAPGGKPDAGPRHLAWHPTLNMAYTSDEKGSSITAYTFDPNTGLTPVQTLSTLPPDFAGSNSTAEVKVHPTGRFVWVTNRGHDSLAGFTIDPAGRLAPNGWTPTEKTPRSFDIDSSGKFAFGAGEGSGRLAIFSVNDTTGQMKRLDTLEVGKSLSWVLAVDVP
jgi:6-phosphogluconolactonase